MRTKEGSGFDPDTIVARLRCDVQRSGKDVRVSILLDVLIVETIIPTMKLG